MRAMLRWLAVAVSAYGGLLAQELVTSYHEYSPRSVTARLHRGFESADDERAWTIVLGVSLPLGQLQDSLWLLGVASHLLQANSLNDIGFNPRGARWEEQLVVLWKRSPWTIYGGLLHFCKHEIDNADPPDTDDPVVGYQPTKRVIILHGPFLGASYRYRWALRWELTAEVRTFFFLIAQDYRIRGNDELRWRRLRYSAAARVGVRWETSAFRSFVQLSSRAALFTAPVTARYEYRVEVGSSVAGLPIALFGYREWLFDDLARPFPHPSRSFGIGLQWFGNE